jgi:hypothetical protein
MNKKTFDVMTATALRELDPAPNTPLTDAECDRAEAMLERIVAAPIQEHVPGPGDRTRRRRRRWLGPVGLVGAAGAAGAAVPALLLAGGSAFASWTPTPEELTAMAEAEAAATCQSGLGVPELGDQVVNAERRGGWTYVLIAGPKSEAACLISNDLVGQQIPRDRAREGGFFGTYDPEAVEAPTVASDRMVETEAMQGSVPAPGPWPWPFRGDDGYFTWVGGYVGSDVTEITVHPPTGPDVVASVENGRFAAWWPSDQPSSENTEAMGPWTYTVTLADGSTRAVTG